MATETTIRSVGLTTEGVRALPSRPGAYLLGSHRESFYVGSTDDLRRRGAEHLPANEENDCLRRKKPDTLWFAECSSVAAARQLEKEWYEKHGHECNYQRP